MKRLQTKQSMVAAGVATLALAGSGVGQAMAAPTAQVQLNGQPLATRVAPLVTNGRTLVPMRDIFEALGASVQWNAATHDVMATRGAKKVWLQIGNKVALVNDKRVMLDQAAMLHNGSTMVPLRFVSESLGANVMWNDTQRIASIFTPVRTGSETLPARTITVPANAIVRVKMDQALSSATARVGDTFTATVVSKQPGDSEFPAGSRISGVVTEARAKTKDAPGVLGVDFNTLLLPDGARYPIDGNLASLEAGSVTETNGHVIAKADNKSTDWKIDGIGAAAGFVLGKVLDQNKILSAVLGAAGGYLYDRSRQKDDVREAVVSQGEELGVRLTRSLTYTDAVGYADQRASYLR